MFYEAFKAIHQPIATETLSKGNIVFLKGQQLHTAAKCINLCLIIKADMYAAWEPACDETHISNMHRQEMESRGHSWCH